MISYTKLRNGDWGIKVLGGKPTPGTIVTVTKRSGETKSETVDKVVWSNEDTTICSVVKVVPKLRSFGRCGCDCCRPCRCESHCVCRGGNVWDCD